MVQIPDYERELMATVYLKDGTKVEVTISELGEYQGSQPRLNPSTET
jgi:hypothetical protein